MNNFLKNTMCYNNSVQSEDILYELHDGKPVEVRIPAKFPLSDTPPLFEGNAVSKPIVVCKEGVYAKPALNKQGDVVLKKITFTKNDLDAFVNNATRDVPLNIDHVRGGFNWYGWVRCKTGEFKVEKDVDGRWALFAQIEVTKETLEAIERGLVRDFSPEIRPYEKRFVGLALTNYPVMQNLHQFSEAFDEGDDMTVEEFKQYKEQMDQQFAELRAKLEESEAARYAAEVQARTAKLVLEFSEKVNKLINNNGKARIAPSMKDAVLNLYIFAAEHSDSTITFNENGTEVTVSPVELLDKVFNSLATTSLYEQLTPSNYTGVVEDEFSDSEFDVEAAKRLARQKLSELVR